MNRILRRLPLMAKLATLALLPVFFAAYLTFELYREKSANVAEMKGYLDRIHQTGSISRLIDQLQMERRYSLDYAMRGKNKNLIPRQRQLTDSLIRQMESKRDPYLTDFKSYAFLENLDSVRQRIDRNAYPPNRVMHFYSSAVFRFSTLNRLPSFSNEFLQTLYDDLMVQQLLSEFVTYQSIITANIYNLLYTQKFIPETLAGTLPSYDIYKSYDKELVLKASPSSWLAFERLRKQGALGPVQAELQKIFSGFRLDSTYNYQQWRQLSLKSINELRDLQMVHLRRAENNIQALYEAEVAARTKSIILLALFCIIIVAFAIYTLAGINQTLKRLQAAAGNLALGKTGIQVAVPTSDSIGRLAAAIVDIDRKNKELALAAGQIGSGDFTAPIVPRSPEDVVGNAIVQMRDNLQRYTADLENSRADFKMLADFMPQIVWTADAQGKITYYNHKWYELTGAREGYGEQSWIPVLHPNDVGLVLNTWYEAIEKGTPFLLEYRLRDVQHGGHRWFMGRSVPVKDAAGNIIKWFGTCTDIHDKKMENERLEQLVAERTLALNRSNEDLQHFAHVASHDLKEPLRKIRTFSSRLVEEFGHDLPDRGKIYIDKVQHSSERMTNMIEGILNYSVLNANEQPEETINLNLTLKDIQSDLELLIMQKEAQLSFSNLPHIKGVPTLIYQLFYNLVGNALKFTKAGTPARINISASGVSPQELTEVLEIRHTENYYRITVQDNGIGFNQEYANKMFQVFTRLHAKDRYEGTGLGLALCKKIVHRHHGVITATGEEGNGAAFHVYLPAYK